MSKPEKVARPRVEKMPNNVSDMLPVLKSVLGVQIEEGADLIPVGAWESIVTGNTDPDALLKRYETVITLKVVFHKLAKVMKVHLEGRPDVNLSSLKKKKRSEAKDGNDLEATRKALADRLEELKKCKKKAKKQKLVAEVIEEEATQT